MPVSLVHQSDPEFGTPVQVAEGIWWIRLPIALSVNHVNVYLLEDDAGWVLVDTGLDSEPSRSVLTDAISVTPFAEKPIIKVIVTHYHPDHVGMAGNFTNAGATENPAELLTSRTCWQTSNLLHADNPPTPCVERVRFMQNAGINGIELESFKRRPPSSYAKMVCSLPRSYTRLIDQQTLKIGNRSWRIIIGNGHADEHVTLWSDDNIAIVGDQILPAISPNLSVHFSEPNADVVSEWLESCVNFGSIADDETLCLPGHNRPYTGVPTRCFQFLDNCEQIISRIEQSLKKPKTAADLMTDIYRREISSNEKFSLIGETMGYLNHLLNTNRVKRRVSSTGAFRWQLN
ncbi:MAG: MBL fold metallo-hydrolase [Granulosicoccus sp.]|nr:MBL fold metallo-hydrolase [Granulosicoccus sp.]